MIYGILKTFFFKQAIRIIFYAVFSFHPPSSWDLNKGCETALPYTSPLHPGLYLLSGGEGNTTPRKNIISDIDMSRDQIRAPRGPRWLGRFSFSDEIAVRFYFRSISMTQPSDGHSRRGGGVLFPSLFAEKRHSRWSRRIPQALPEGGGKIVLAQIGDSDNAIGQRTCFLQILIILDYYQQLFISLLFAY